MLENSYFKIGIVDNILICRYKKVAINGYESAKEIVDYRLEHFGDKDHLFLVDVRGLISLDKEARNYFGSEAGSKRIKACSFLIKSEVHKVMGNFFFRFNQPPIPSKIFTDEKDAIEWLKNF